MQIVEESIAQKLLNIGDGLIEPIIDRSELMIRASSFGMCLKRFLSGAGMSRPDLQSTDVENTMPPSNSPQPSEDRSTATACYRCDKLA
jgi:hypothetical protein